MKRVVSPALVGRTEELDQIAAALGAPPAVVLIDGEAGVGKTRLVIELGGRSEVTGRRLLVGRCHGIRESFPLGPVVEALRGHGDELTGKQLTPVVGALRALVPEMADKLPPAPVRLDDRAAERHRVFRALVEVLTSLSPAVLVLEDLHWADDQTIDLLGYLLAEPPPELGMVLTFRGDQVDPRVRSAVAKLPASTTRTDIDLRPLGEGQTGALAAAIVGADHVSDEFAQYLWERSSGLPFAVEELLALLQDQGKLIRREGGWERRTLDELDVPSGIRDPVLERVSHLSNAATSVVEAAAVLQVPVPADALVATARCAPASEVLAMAETLKSGLLVEAGPTIGFRHLLAAQAVYDQIDGPSKRQLHGRAADALEEVRPVPLGQVAHHLRHAGKVDEWVTAAERAAEQALELGHETEAFRLLEDVLRNAPLDPHRRGRLAIWLGQSAVEALRARDVVGLLSDVLDQDLPAEVRGELKFQVGLLLHETEADAPRVRRLLAEAVEELPDRPDLRAWAMVVLGVPSAAGVDAAEHRAWLRRALEIVPTITDPVFEVFLLGKIAMLLVPFGDAQWREITERIEELTDRTPTHRHELNAYYSVGVEACYAGHHDKAGQLLAAGLAGAVEGENRRMELGLRSAQTLLRYCQGSWDGVADDARRLTDQLAGTPRFRIDAETAGGCLALLRGDLDEAHDVLTTVVELLERFGGFDILPLPAAALLRAHTSRGDLAAASEAADRLVAAVESNGVWPAGLRALPVIIEVLVRSGRQGDAAGVIARFADALAGLDAPLGTAALPHARGVLRMADRDPGGAATEFDAASEAYLRLGCPYESALATEQAAVCRFAVADTDAAEKSLQAALAGFRQLGAEWDAARATKLARGHGVSVPARHRGGRRGYGNELSPREREVAELAATGMTNKEIAAALFLSVNTVSRHISAAMRKLDVSSRTALAHRLASRSGDQN